MDVRQFKLINAYGNSYDLTLKDTAFMHSVDALGYQATTEYQRIGNHYTLLSYLVNQNVIRGIVKFWERTEFFEFAKFAQQKPVTLQYIRDGITFNRDGVITKIGKSETNTAPLSSDIEFTCTTPFYQVVNRFNNAGVSGGKVYDYTYDYTYSDDIPQTIMITSDSVTESPLKIEIYGPVVNPTWRHYVNNILVATGAVEGTIESGRKLVIDTTSTPYKIQKMDMSNNVILDMYQFSDFTTERFCMLQLGLNTISVAGDTANIIPLGVEAMLEYETV